MTKLKGGFRLVDIALKDVIWPGGIVEEEVLNLETP